MAVYTALMLSSAAVCGEQAADLTYRAAQEDDIRESVFLYLFDVTSGPKSNRIIYCLSVDYAGTADFHDPSDAFMKRFPKTRATLRKASGCEVLKKSQDLFAGIRDKQTGKPAWMISVDRIHWVDADEAHVVGMTYCGGLCSWSTEFKVTSKDGKWMAQIGDIVFFSRARNIDVREGS